jgi:hypothetical protein
VSKESSWSTVLPHDLTIQGLPGASPVNYSRSYVVRVYGQHPEGDYDHGGQRTRITDSPEAPATAPKPCRAFRWPGRPPARQRDPIVVLSAARRLIVQALGISEILIA